MATTHMTLDEPLTKESIAYIRQSPLLVIKKVIIYFILVIFTFGCNSNENRMVFTPLSIKDTVFLEGKVLCDSLLIGVFDDIDFYKDYLVLVAYSEGKFIHIFDRTTGKCLKDFVTEGRGPNEIISIYAIDVDHATGLVSTYDMAKRLNEFMIDSILFSPSYQIKTHHSRFGHRYTYRINENTFVAGNSITRNKKGEIQRLVKVKDDSIVYAYKQYPEVGKAFQESMDLAYLNTGVLAVSPDRTKMACGASWGAILEIFDIRDSIELIATRYILRPVGERIRSELRPIKGQTIFGFGDLYATEHYIYTIFRGKIYGDPDKPSYIAVFDWEGNCVKFYKTEYRLQNLCVDEHTNKIYATGVAKNLESAIIEFTME